MKKRFFALALTLAILCSVILPGLTLTANAGEIGDTYWTDNFKYEYDEATKTLTVFTMSDPDSLVSNDTYSKIPWTIHRDNVEKVILKDTVKEIVPYAFNNFYSLESVEISKGISSIGYSAFSNCELTNVTIPTGVTSIGDYAFFWCQSLMKVTIPDSVTYIGKAAFCGCTELTNVTIPAGIVSIKEASFRYCSSLTSVVIPEGVTSIETDAFSDCSALISVTIPASVSNISLPDFSNCAELSEIRVDSMNSVYCSDQCGVLYNREKTELYLAPCSAVLQNYILPKNLTHIRPGAFLGCKNLTGIEIPEGITSFGQNTFRGCSDLTSITIPRSVQAIGLGAFANCENLTSISIPDGIKVIEDYTFSGCKKLSDVSLPESIIRIGEWAFFDCNSLSSVIIPVNVTAIGKCSFDKCSSLESITIPQSVTSIGSQAFENCLQLTKISVDLENNAFCNDKYGVLYNKEQTQLLRAPCAAPLGDYVIPKSVTYIDDSAFSYCNKMTNVTIPEGVTSIGFEVFAGCDNLISAIIPESITSVGYYTFLDCKSLQNVCFKGNAPVCYDNSFSWWDENVKHLINNPNLTLYYIEGKEGWTSPTWNGYPTATWDGVNPPQPHVHSYTAVVTAPTCTERGYTTHTCECGASYIDTYTAALGHDWKAPTYAWAEDCGSITAARVCKNDASHVETEKGVITSAVTKEATYEAQGEINYTAVFTNPAFAAQTKTAATPKLEKPAPADNPFGDVAETAYYFAPVQWAVQNNITTGTAADAFSPEQGCTRAQVVTFLWRAAGKPEPASSKNPFTDVAETAYYYKAVLWAVEQGITNGMTADTFGPENTCTRAQIVTFLWRFEGQPAPTSQNNPFTDVNAASYYGSAVLWAGEKAITNGMTATTFGPENTCTRGQIVTFLYRDIAKK